MGCYNCESRLGSDQKCEDGSYTAPYQENCVPSEGGQGFGIYAHYCVKVVGRDTHTNQYVTVRTCSNRFRNECKNPLLINGRTIDGCVYSCSGKYCNSARVAGLSAFLALPLLAIALHQAFELQFK